MRLEPHFLYQSSLDKASVTYTDGVLLAFWAERRQEREKNGRYRSGSLGTLLTILMCLNNISCPGASLLMNLHFLPLEACSLECLFWPLRWLVTTVEEFNRWAHNRTAAYLRTGKDLAISDCAGQ